LHSENTQTHTPSIQYKQVLRSSSRYRKRVAGASDKLVHCWEPREEADIRCTGTYHVHMGFLCTYHARELIKFTKKYEKITHILSIVFHLCIKFEVQTHYSLATIKKRKNLTDL
jgi:hypothetical protein